MKYFNSSRIIFIIIAIFYAVGNFIWWRLNTPIIPYNVEALHFLDVFNSNLLSFNAPLVSLITKFLFSLYGKEYFDLIIIIINYLFFLIGLYFIYKVVLYISSKYIANISMILFSIIPAVYGMSRFYGRQDYHVMIMIIVTIYCLIKTNYLNDRKWTIWLGISIGLGLLCKDSFLAYFFVPYIYILIVCFKKNSFRNKNLINIIISILIPFMLSCCHYCRPSIILKVFFEPITEVSNMSLLFKLKELTIALSEELFSIPIFLLFIIALVWYLMKYKNEYKIIFILWIFTPWIILLLMKHYTNSIFCMGMIPAVVIISSLFLGNIKKLFAKKILVCLFTVIGILQFIEYSYSINIGFSNLKINNLYYFNKTIHLENKNKEYFNYLNETLKIIKSYYPSKIFIVFNHNLDFKFADFISFMYVNDIFFNYDSLMSWTDVFTVDTIIYIGDYFNYEQQANLFVADIKSHPITAFENIDVKHFLNEFYMFSKIRNNIIKDYFVLDKEYNLNHFYNNLDKIIVLKRKK